MAFSLQAPQWSSMKSQTCFSARNLLLRHKFNAAFCYIDERQAYELETRELNDKTNTIDLYNRQRKLKEKKMHIVKQYGYAKILNLIYPLKTRVPENYNRILRLYFQPSCPVKKYLNKYIKYGCFSLWQFSLFIFILYNYIFVPWNFLFIILFCRGKTVATVLPGSLGIRMQRSWHLLNIIRSYIQHLNFQGQNVFTSIQTYFIDLLFLNRSINNTFPYSNYRSLISMPIELNSNFSIRFNGAVQDWSSLLELSPTIQQIL